MTTLCASCNEPLDEAEAPLGGTCAVCVKKAARGMPALTLWQPWATLVASGFKTIETRRHWRYRQALQGRWVAIHAGKRYDTETAEEAKGYLHRVFDLDIGHVEQLFEEARRECGQILATAWVVAVRGMGPVDEASALCPWDHRLVAYLLEDVERLRWPVEAKGKQGVWYPKTQGVVLPERGES